MKSIVQKLTLAVLLGAPLGAHAAFTPFPDGGFDSGQGTWGTAGPATFSYPASGGNPGGYGVMNAATGWGVWVNNNNNGSFIPLSTLGLVAGNGYTFKMDMRVEEGSPNTNLGKLKLEWQGGPGGVFGPVQPTLVNNAWNTYTWDVLIPAGVTGMKIVPVNENGASIGFDNIGYESVPYFVAPPPPPPLPEPKDVVLSEAFNVASTRWGTPGVPPGGTSSVTWSDTEGNPPGSTRFAAANPAGSPAGIRFAYTATGVDFGTTGPVTISFDAKGTALVGTALHVRFNGNFVGAIQGSFNDATYTNFSRTFDLKQGFEGTDTFVLDFEFAMGAVPNSGGGYSIDNIKVLSNLPGGQPFAASIQLGTLVAWTPTVAGNTYQPQESADGISFTNLGPAITGTSVNSAFDPTPAFSYRVEEAAPQIQEVAYNGGFEEEFLGDLEGWIFFGSQKPTLIDTDARTGTNSVRIMAAATVADPVVPTYAAGVSGFEQNTTNATTDSNPGGPLVTPGNTYNFSFWAKQISSGPGYVQNYRVAWLDSIGAIVGDGGFQTFSGAIGVWEKKVQNGLVAPARAASAQILMQGLTGAFDGSMGQVIIDDISLETTGTGSATILAATAVPAAEISWASKPGLTYRVNSSLNLDGFSSFAGPFTGDNTIMKVYDAPLVARKFYQVTED